MVRRGAGAARWRHGWVPLNAAAVRVKRHGGGGVSAKAASGARAVRSSKSAGLGAKVPRASKPARKPLTISNPNVSRMSKQDKINAAAIMHGTGSKQHRAAIKKFRG